MLDDGSHFRRICAKVLLCFVSLFAADCFHVGALLDAGSHFRRTCAKPGSWGPYASQLLNWLVRGVCSATSGS